MSERTIPDNPPPQPYSISITEKKAKKLTLCIRGEMGLLSKARSTAAIYQAPSTSTRPLTESEIIRLSEIIEHDSEFGIMREEAKGLRHPDTLHSFLRVVQAYFYLGQYDQAQYLFEQVFLLSDDKSRPEFTAAAASFLNCIYRTKGFQASMRALKKKASTSTTTSRRRK